MIVLELWNNQKFYWNCEIIKNLEIKQILAFNNLSGDDMLLKRQT